MNITNIINLFRAYFIENKKKLIRACIIAFGAAAFLSTIDTASMKIFTVCFSIILAGTFYQHSLKKNNSVHFFNLSATAGEKLIHAVLVLVIVVVGVQPLLLAGAYVGTYLLQPLFFHDMHLYTLTLETNIWEQTIIISWKEYLHLFAAISAFLFGSIYFKKNAVWKTLGTGIGFLIGLAFFSILLFYIAFGNLKENLGNEMIHINYEFLGDYHYIVSTTLIAFFLSLTYLRLKETEV